MQILGGAYHRSFIHKCLKFFVVHLRIPSKSWNHSYATCSYQTRYVKRYCCCYTRDAQSGEYQTSFPIHPRAIDECQKLETVQGRNQSRCKAIMRLRIGTGSAPTDSTYSKNSHIVSKRFPDSTKWQKFGARLSFVLSSRFEIPAASRALVNSITIAR